MICDAKMGKRKRDFYIKVLLRDVGRFFVLFIIYFKSCGQLLDSKYLTALKAELAKRENLRKHEKKSAYKKSFI
jgi:hypothetical protein